MRVRLGTEADMAWLVAQTHAIAATHPAPLPIHGGDAHLEVYLGTLMRDQFLAIATRDDGTRVGLVAGARGPHPYNPDLTLAASLFWWVVPDARGSSAAPLLLSALEGWADGLGVPLVVGVHEASGVGQGLARRGYQPIERQYLRMPA